MESLPLVNRNRMFYGKYMYRAIFELPGAYFLWRYKPKISMTISEDQLKKNYVTYSHEPIIINSLPSLNIVHNYTVDNKKSKELTRRIEGKKVSFYSNDLNQLMELKTLLPDLDIKYDVANVDKVSGIKCFSRQPKHQYRTYFKSKRISIDEAQNLQRTLNANTEFDLSHGLKKWLTTPLHDWRKRYVYSNFHVNYNSDSLTSYLAIKHGDILGEHYKLEKRTETK